jgi:hypothetical protein
MGNALWTGVKLRDVLEAAKVKGGSVQVQFEGLDRGKGPTGYGSNRFMKSLDLNNPVIDEVILAYAMNNKPLPVLNGFPLRVVVPGYFATYWLKSLSSIRVLDKADDNFWMKTAYRIPDTLVGQRRRNSNRKVSTVPINKLPVRTFPISPTDRTRFPRVSHCNCRHCLHRDWRHSESGSLDDNGKSWHEAAWQKTLASIPSGCGIAWTAKQPGTYQIAVRATMEAGTRSPIKPSGIRRIPVEQIERQEFVVGSAPDSRENDGSTKVVSSADGNIHGPGWHSGLRAAQGRPI